MNLGANIRQIREQKGLTQEYMAKQLGVSQPAYSKMEAANSDIPVRKLLQIADSLQVSLDEIMYLDSEPSIAETANFASKEDAAMALSAKESELYERHIERLERDKDRIINTYEKKIDILQDYIATLKKLASERK